MFCNRKSAIWNLLILLMLPIILSSCVNGSAHVKVHLNGTVNLNLSVAISKDTLKLLGQSDVLLKLTDTLKEKNIDAKMIENNDSLEVSVSKVIDIKNMSSESKTKEEEIKFVKIGETNFLFTRYDISVDANPIQLLASETNLKLMEIPELAKNFIGSQMKFDLLLTTPIELHNHNASLVKGKTLIWNINLFESNHLQFSVLVPNFKNISFILGIGFLIILFIIIRIRFSKTVGEKTKTSASFESEDKLH